MGYTTSFQGELKFKQELSATELAELRKYLGKDRRDIGWGKDKLDVFWCHIDFEFNDDFSGIRWDGSEKFYDADDVVNFLTDRMREKYPEFELVGELSAQGESYDDRWILRMVNGVATRIEHPRVGQKIECPHCGDEFVLEAK